MNTIEEQLKEYEETFNLIQEADERAKKIWRDATGEELAAPDRADLLIFLMQTVDYMAAQISEYNKCLRVLNKVNDLGGKCLQDVNHNLLKIKFKYNHASRIRLPNPEGSVAAPKDKS